MSLFLFTFFLVYGGTHAYALLKAKSSLGFGWSTALFAAPALLLLTCAPLLVYALGKRGMEEAARAVSWIGYTWMGILFFFTWMNLALDAVNLAARLAGAAAGRWMSPSIVSGRTPFLALAGLSVAFAAYSYVEASSIRVETVRIVTDRLPASAPRMRIAQISDVHFGRIVRHAKARAIADLVRRENPDLLVSTGDLVDASINHLEGLAEILREIRPRLGKYAVTGNHEFYAGIDQALSFTRRAGFTVLRWEATDVGGVVRLAGVDDPAGEAFGAKPPRSEADLLGESRSPLFTLLLKHRPEPSESSRGLFDLQLSGHTHNGQLFPFRILSRIRYPLLKGLHDVGGGARLYTSPGTGTWGPPMRFLSPPEITVFDIGRADPGTEG